MKKLVSVLFAVLLALQPIEALAVLKGVASGQGSTLLPATAPNGDILVGTGTAWGLNTLGSEFTNAGNVLDYTQGIDVQPGSGNTAIVAADKNKLVTISYTTPYVEVLPQAGTAG